MKKIFNIIIIFLLFISIDKVILANYLEVEGWKLIESKEKIFLCQKKKKEFTSEVIVNLSVGINGEILRGYSIKKDSNILISDYFTNSYPFAIWKVIYNGFDSSGNIYLKLFREKEDIDSNNIKKIKEEIKRISSLSEEEENIIEKRLEFYNFILDDYLDKEGEFIIIDPKKIIIISGINDIPPIHIEANDKHSVINISIVSLD